MAGRIKREMAVNPLPSRLGKIKVGIKNDRGLPQSVDYFVATGKYAPLFNEAFGEKPNSLLVYFPSSDAELVCKEEYVYRDKSGAKIASGDGEVFKVWSNKVNQFVRTTIEDVPNLMELVESKYPSRTGWQVTLTLRVILPQLNKIYGYWEFQTKGAMSSIPQVRDTFDSLLSKNGKIEGVLCDLNVEFAKSDSPKTSRYPVVSLVPNETRANIQRLKNLELEAQCGTI